MLRPWAFEIRYGRIDVIYHSFQIIFGSEYIRNAQTHTHTLTQLTNSIHLLREHFKYRILTWSRVDFIFLFARSKFWNSKLSMYRLQYDFKMHCMCYFTVCLCSVPKNLNVPATTKWNSIDRKENFWFHIVTCTGFQFKYRSPSIVLVYITAWSASLTLKKVPCKETFLKH